MKKFLTFLICILFIFQTSPAFSITEKQKSKKAQINKKEFINESFWKNYNDSNLEYFLFRALEANHDLKLAGLNSEIYSQYIKISRAGQMPTVGAGFSPSYSKMPYTTDFDMSYSMPIYVNYEADIFLKNRDKTLISKKDYEMSLLDEQSAYISIASMVGSVYFNILKLNKTISLQKEIVKLREEIYDLMKISHEMGAIPVQDVIAAHKSLLKGQTDLNDYKKLNEQFAHNLAVLIAANPDEVRDFIFSDIEKSNYLGQIPNSVNSDAITKRPDYKKAEIAIERAGINIRAAKKEFLPSFSITGLGLFGSDKIGSLLTTKSALISMGASAFADLFTGGRKIANFKIKKSEYQKMLTNYEKTNLTALQEVNDALVAIKYDLNKLEEVKFQNSLEERDFAIKKAHFDNGVISKLELLQAKENLLVIKNLFYSNKAGCFIDYIGLYKALGANI